MLTADSHGLIASRVISHRRIAVFQSVDAHAVNFMGTHFPLPSLVDNHRVFTLVVRCEKNP